VAGFQTRRCEAVRERVRAQDFQSREWVFHRPKRVALIPVVRGDSLASSPSSNRVRRVVLCCIANWILRPSRTPLANSHGSRVQLAIRQIEICVTAVTQTLDIMRFSVFINATSTTLSGPAVMEDTNSLIAQRKAKSMPCAPRH